jgi:hypothetical protein
LLIVTPGSNSPLAGRQKWVIHRRAFIIEGSKRQDRRGAQGRLNLDVIRGGIGKARPADRVNNLGL